MKEKYVFSKLHLLYFLIVSYIILLFSVIYSVYVGKFTVEMVPTFLVATIMVFVMAYSLNDSKFKKLQRRKNKSKVRYKI